MMIKLTLQRTGNPVYVSAQLVAMVSKKEVGSGTELIVAEDTVTVRETAEEVSNAITQTLWQWRQGLLPTYYGDTLLNELTADKARVEQAVGVTHGGAR